MEAGSFPIAAGPRSLEKKSARFSDRSAEVFFREAQFSLTNLGFLESSAATHDSTLAVRTVSAAGKVLAPNLVISSRYFPLPNISAILTGDFVLEEVAKYVIT